MGMSNYIHIRIAEHLEKIERQQEVQSKRRRRIGHVDEEERENQDISAYFWDYNTVELFLLGCAIFVCVSGVMFESQSFDSRADLDSYLSALAGIVMFVIIFSLVYYGVVFLSEVFAALGLQNNKWIQKYFMEKKDQYEEDEEELERQKATAELEQENAKILAQIKRLKKENQSLQLRDKQVEKKVTRKKKKRVFDEGEGTDDVET